MKYIVVNFRFVEGRASHNEILIARLSLLGYEAFEEHFDGIDAYVLEDDFDEKNVKELQEEFLGKLDFDFQWHKMEDKNWNEQWESNYKCIEIEDKLLIRSSFYEPESVYDYQVVIDPKMAFGTGHHETTKLMLREILETNLDGKKVLDIGCGTGVLSIVASLKGASCVDAVDIDENAYQNTLENLKVNSVENVNVMKGGIEMVSGTYDLILANINRNILLQDLEKYKDLMRDGGVLLISGFYEKDVILFDSLCEKLMLRKCKVSTDNDWAMVKIGQK